MVISSSSSMWIQILSYLVLSGLPMAPMAPLQSKSPRVSQKYSSLEYYPFDPTNALACPSHLIHQSNFSMFTTTATSPSKRLAPHRLSKVLHSPCRNRPRQEAYHGWWLLHHPCQNQQRIVTSLRMRHSLCRSFQVNRRPHALGIRSSYGRSRKRFPNPTWYHLLPAYLKVSHP